jgi:TolB-like protein
MYFMNPAGGGGDLTPLQKGLAEMLITDLSQVPSLAIVERARLQQLMQEIGLGMTGVVDESAVMRMGKLLGAAQIVQGTLLDLGNNDFRVDAALVQLKQGKMKNPQEVNGSLSNFFILEKDLVFGIIDDLGIVLTNRERKAIEKLPTKNLLAFMAYCRALDNEDKGLYDQANAEYETALKNDAQFSLAKKGLTRVQAFSNFSTEIPKPGPEIAKSLPAPDLLKSQLARTAGNVGAGFVPGIESRKPTTEQSSPNFGSSVPIQIKIPLPIIE